MFRSFLRPVAALAALSGLAAYATIMLRGPQGLNALVEKNREIRVLEAANDRIRHENELKRTHNERLESNESEQQVELYRRGFLYPKDTSFKATDRSMQVPAPGGLSGSTAAKR